MGRTTTYELSVEFSQPRLTSVVEDEYRVNHGDGWLWMTETCTVGTTCLRCMSRVFQVASCQEMWGKLL